ncbi:hypothetical protein [Nesterenkonia pannonica]|uniref:hypothetical protein n=1 Tax=Nesterenkonia pannonica TaxID=1548602 RepID=UPI00216423A0|nr:hypothetical protein [Nesterenkonia pannonica]
MGITPQGRSQGSSAAATVEPSSAWISTWLTSCRMTAAFMRHSMSSSEPKKVPEGAPHRPRRPR